MSGLVTTPDKSRAILERSLFDGATAAERGAHNGIGPFIQALDRAVSIYEVKLRSRLLFAGDRADAFWLRVERGMPLATAVRLLRDAERIFRSYGEKRPIDTIIDDVLAHYDRSGHSRVVGDKVVRTRATVSERAAKIAKGQSAPGPAALGARKPGSRSAIREACAAWVARALPAGDPRADQFTSDVLREIEVVLDSFAQRLRPSEMSKAKLHAACDALNIPRPRWGQRADQERAWKHRKNVLKATHPDAVGHSGALDAFQAINDAYDVVVAYNDGLSHRMAVDHGG